MNRRYALMSIVMFFCGLTGAFVHRALQPPRAEAFPIMQVESGETDLPVQPAPQSPGAQSGSQSAGSLNVDDEDALNTALLTRAGHGEAINWLTQRSANRAVAEWDKQEAIDLVQAFYAAGAKQIDVVDTVVAGENEIASQFVITLPDDSEARKKVFAEEADFESQYNEQPTPDRGQKYLHITTD